MKEHSISYVAVDLRNNGGGNSQVINEFLRYVDVNTYSVVGGMDVDMALFYGTSKQERTRIDALRISIYWKTLALTSKKTFSSAAMFAVTLLTIIWPRSSAKYREHAGQLW